MIFSVCGLFVCFVISGFTGKVSAAIFDIGMASAGTVNRLGCAWSCVKTDVRQKGTKLKQWLHVQIKNILENFKML